MVGNQDTNTPHFLLFERDLQHYCVPPIIVRQGIEACGARHLEDEAPLLARQHDVPRRAIYGMEGQKWTTRYYMMSYKQRDMYYTAAAIEFITRSAAAAAAAEKDSRQQAESFNCNTVVLLSRPAGNTINIPDAWRADNGGRRWEVMFSLLQNNTHQCGHKHYLRLMLLVQVSKSEDSEDAATSCCDCTHLS